MVRSAPSMQAVLQETAGFLPIALLQGIAVLTICVLRLPPKSVRFALAALILVAPVWCPTRGLLSTFFTGLSVVIACRMADLSRFRDRSRRAALILWLLCPAVRTLPSSPEARARNRKRAPRTLARALAKRGLWELIALLVAALPPEADGFWVRSASLILYFVLNLTALADLVICIVQLLGASIDELFDWPLLARSPRDFWSRRWNRFISRFALKHVALPLSGKLHPTFVTLIVFFLSGLFHEYFAWGAAGKGTLPLSMMTFFLIHGAVVAVAQTHRAFTQLPAPVTHILTFLLMLVTSPLFFRAIVPPLVAFGADPARLPWSGPALDWLPFF